MNPMKKIYLFVLAVFLLLCLVPAALASDCCDCCNCEPRTPGYWKNHPDAWPTFNGVDIVDTVCGDWLETLKTPPRGDAEIILCHQYIAAVLNRMDNSCCCSATVDCGITVSSYVTDAYTCLFDGDNFDGNGGCSREGMISLAEILDQFNNGYFT